MIKDTKLFTHAHPIKEDGIDSIVLVPVIEPGYSEYYDYEEIPSMTVGSNLYRLHASPLLVRNLNLDDIVMADDNGMFVNLEKDSGKFGFRVGMQIHQDDHDELSKYNKVVDRLRKLDCDVEFYSHHLIGVVAKNRWKARKVQSGLLKLVNEGLIIGIETNRK